MIESSTTNTLIPNGIIFRIPDEDNEPLFVQIPIKGDKFDKEQPTQIFSVVPDDDYRQLTFDNLIIAELADNSSIPISIFSIVDNDTGNLAQVYRMNLDLIEQDILPILLKEINT